MGFWDTVGKVADTVAQKTSDSYYDADTTAFAMSDHELAKILTGQ